jgi:hypothetical protein
LSIKQQTSGLKTPPVHHLLVAEPGVGDEPDMRGFRWLVATPRTKPAAGESAESSSGKAQ